MDVDCLKRTQISAKGEQADFLIAQEASRGWSLVNSWQPEGRPSEIGLDFIKCPDTIAPELTVQTSKITGVVTGFELIYPEELDDPAPLPAWDDDVVQAGAAPAKGLRNLIILGAAAYFLLKKGKKW